MAEHPYVSVIDELARNGRLRTMSWWNVARRVKSAQHDGYVEEPFLPACFGSPRLPGSNPMSATAVAGTDGGFLHEDQPPLLRRPWRTRIPSRAGRNRQVPLDRFRSQRRSGTQPRARPHPVPQGFRSCRIADSAHRGRSSTRPGNARLGSLSAHRYGASQILKGCRASSPSTLWSEEGSPMALQPPQPDLTT